MSIKITNGFTQKEQRFDEIHLSKFVLEQPMVKGGKKTIKLRAHLRGVTDEGETAFSKESRWEWDCADMDTFAIKLYCEQKQCTPQQAYMDYMAMLDTFEDMSLLEAMAGFQAGIARIYETQTGTETDVF